jgi:hypothetical protein
MKEERKKEERDRGKKGGTEGRRERESQGRRETAKWGGRDAKRNRGISFDY